jgi:hypothetical protein
MHAHSRFSRLPLLATFLALVAALLLSGCASTVRSEISAINKLPPDLKDKRFEVARYKGQEGNLEFDHYAELVSAELVAKGLRRASAGSADLLVFLRYTYEQRTEFVPTPLWGPTGFAGGTTVIVNGRAVFVPTYSTPVYGVTGMGYAPATVNRRSFGLDIVDKSSTQEMPNKLYEANVFSEGYSGTLMQVMPVMIRALFTDWPGPPVRSDIVSLPAQPKAPPPAAPQQPRPETRQ